MDAAFVTTPHFSTRGGIAPISTGKMRQIFDFIGFPPEFYEVKYEPPGNPELAKDLVSMGRSSGLTIAETGQWGLDHGAWAFLVHLFPAADVPVVPVSMMAGGDPAIYRLDLFQHPSGKIPEDAVEYLNMVLNFMGKSDWKGVWNIPEKNYRAAAPEGGLAQFMALAGATGDKFRAEGLSNEIMYDSVSMTTIDFS